MKGFGSVDLVTDQGRTAGASIQDVDDMIGNIDRLIEKRRDERP